MKSRPILFQPEMVAAILDGRKTQTRRVIKRQPLRAHDPDVEGYSLQDFSDNPETMFDHDHVLCPQGIAGDKLMVRESCQLHGRWIKNGIGKNGRQKWKFLVSDRIAPKYNGDFVESPKDRTLDGYYMRPSIHVPRWAWRIELCITRVRVERLQDISHRDALAEGVAYDVSLPDGSPCPRFEKLWRKINGSESWDANPWVWVIEFERIKP